MPPFMWSISAYRYDATSLGLESKRLHAYEQRQEYLLRTLCAASNCCGTRRRASFSILYWPGMVCIMLTSYFEAMLMLLHQIEEYSSTPTPSRTVTANRLHLSASTQVLCDFGNFETLGTRSWVYEAKRARFRRGILPDPLEPAPWFIYIELCLPATRTQRFGRTSVSICSIPLWRSPSRPSSLVSPACCALFR